jgi:hypothetical protein
MATLDVNSIRRKREKLEAELDALHAAEETATEKRRPQTPGSHGICVFCPQPYSSAGLVTCAVW